MIEKIPAVVLASASPIRSQLLRSAGVDCGIAPAGIDEDEVKRTLRAEGADAGVVADTLAELKSRQVAAGYPGALVIGVDQVLDCQGILFDKPSDFDHARAQLVALRGRTHDLVVAVTALRDGDRLWHHIDRARLTMRDFSDDFLDAYLAVVGEDALATVGAYRLEGPGVQLFARIDGDYFTILGLPLLPLLDFLRNQGVVRR